MQEIKIGDIVILKTGGPEMTAECIYDQNNRYKGKVDYIDHIDCIWFDENQKLIRKTFHKNTLKLKEIKN